MQKCYKEMDLVICLLGQFDTDYVTFRNVENFNFYFFQIKKYCEENIEYLGIFHLLK
jgi:hypothetical protein